MVRLDGNEPMVNFQDHKQFQERCLQDEEFCLEHQKKSLALDLDFPKLLKQDLVVPLDGFNYPCRLKLTPGARYLSVQLHGRTPRGEGTSLPVYARWNWGQILGAHVLSICDPTVYLDDSLFIGWYLGDRTVSAVQGVVAIAQYCAELLDFSEEQIIFSGGSGGGFASLHAAAISKNGRAIPINAQVNLTRYTPEHVNNYIEKVSGCSSVRDAETVFGKRWNAITRMRNSLEAGNSPRLVYVQNRNDWHFKKHFTPFAKEFGLSLQDEQSVSGNFMSILYDGPHAHVVEPTEVVKRINQDAIPFLLEK